MAKIKTTETTKSVTAFINAVSDETKRKDSFQIVAIMQKLAGFILDSEHHYYSWDNN